MDCVRWNCSIELCCLLGALLLVVGCTPRPKYVTRSGTAKPDPEVEKLHAKPPAGIAGRSAPSPDDLQIDLGPPVANFTASDLSSGFGPRTEPGSRRSELHQGLDIRGEKGEAVLATADGKVGYAGWQNGFGRVVILEHERGIHTVYAHLQAIHVRRGDRVPTGRIIGTMGDSGTTTGTHLHFELRRGSRAVDPLPYFRHL